MPFPVRPWVTITLVVLTACTGGTAVSTSGASSRESLSTPIVRDIDALERAKHLRQECGQNSDCPTGSRCDDGVCTWDCLSDSDCGSDHTCNALGVCVVHFTTSMLNNTDACLALPPDEVRAALLGLNQESPPRACSPGTDGETDGCPCGSYCNLEEQCHVDCLDEANPPAGFACGTGQKCTPSGRCVPSSSTTDDPALTELLLMSPADVTANTASGAVVAPITVRLHTNSLSALKDPDPAKVRYHVAGFDDAGGVTPPAGPAPRVKCAESDAFARSCSLDGGWRFHLGTQDFESDPRQIWVQIPQTTIDTRWTLVAISESAADPATIQVRSRPVTIPTTDPGHYTGTAQWANPGAPVGSAGLTLPVEAFVTSDFVALYDAAKLLLPDGHVVLPRDPTKATLLTWLSSSVSGAASKYDVRLDLAPLSYAPATGHLDGSVALTNGTGAAGTSFALSLDRSDGPATPACGASCTSGSYCEATMNLCLPGSGPAASTIVAGSSAIPSATLSSASVATWAPAVTSLRVDPSSPAFPSPLLGYVGKDGFGQAYCYQLNETLATVFGTTRTFQQPSQDLGCKQGTAAGTQEFAQTTFPFENRTTQVTLDSQKAQTFNLLTECLDDLKVAPPANPTISNTLNISPPRACANLAQFFLALRATELSTPNGVLDEATTRLATQALRQWLALNAFVATASVQNRGYDDVLGRTQDETIETRLGGVVDVVDSGLRVLLDPEVRPQFTAGAAAPIVAVAPDYRAQQRPKHRWTFNGTTASTIQDTEGGVNFVTTGVAPANDALFAKNATSATCQTSSPIALDNDRFSISFRLTGHLRSLSGPVTIFEKVAPNGHRIWLEATDDSESGGFNIGLDLRLKDSDGGELMIKEFIFNKLAWKSGSDPDAGWGLIALTIDNTSAGGSHGPYTVMWTSEAAPPWIPGRVPQVFRMGPVGAGKAVKWGPPGIVKLACNLPDHAVGTSPWSPTGLMYDEVSLWSRPISPDEFYAMDALYLDNQHSQSLIPNDTAPGQEQGVSLAAHMLEAANADLTLLQDYLQAERTVSYPECYLGGPSPARDRALGRAGRNLRLVSLLEAEATQMATATGAQAAPWYPRYQAARQSLAGTRATVMQSIGELNACENPLRISEAVLPLYVGQVTGASERFFASTRFLISMATDPVNGPLPAAKAALEAAQNAYNAQVVSDFQRNLTAADKKQTIDKLKVGYEQTLRKYCGLPPTGESDDGFTLFDKFDNGTIDPLTCFLRTELGGKCDKVALLNTPLKALPQDCMRGQLGEHVVALQSAQVDVANAKAEMDRAVTRMGYEKTYCMQREKDLAQRQKLIAAHAQNQIELESERSEINMLLDAGDWLVKLVVSEGMSSADSANFYRKLLNNVINFQEFMDNATFPFMLATFDANLTVKDCFHQVSNLQFSVDAAKATVIRAGQQASAAIFAFNQAQDELSALLVEAKGKIGLETNLDRTPPHLHYWLDNKISTYSRHMTYARRLVYLAVRAFEYEGQQDSGLRGAVLSARQPEQLQTVVDIMLAQSAPFADNDPDIKAVEEPEVFSLKTELLRIENLINNVHLAPGDPKRSDTEIFRALLTSDATKMYDSEGKYIGHGIRFSLRPGFWSAQKCAERLSRIIPLIPTDSPVGLPDHSDVVLIQMNEFGSQQCRAPGAGTLLMTRSGAATNLIGIDVSAHLKPPSPSTSLSLQHAPTTILTRQQLEFDIPMGPPSAFAGRGMYGDYILLFPTSPDPCTDVSCPGWSEDALEDVKDVLFRFEIVDGTRQLN